MSEPFAMSRATLAERLRRAAAAGHAVTLTMEPETAERMAERFEEVDRWCDLAIGRAEADRAAEALIDDLMGANAKAPRRWVVAWCLGLGTGLGLGFWAGELLKGWVG